MYGNAGAAPARSWNDPIAATQRTPWTVLTSAMLVAVLAGHGVATQGFADAAASVVALFVTAFAVHRHYRGAMAGERIYAAVEHERRRIARDIHDGLAQDLAFIAARMRALEGNPAAPARLDLLATAADRALEHSRTAIAALTRPLDEPLDAALARNANELAERHGGYADLRLEPGIVVAATTRESLVRIVREAVTNAMRHGRARRVVVALSQDRVLRLSIGDDGCGFDVAGRAAYPDAGFGLLSMEERAAALGGSLAIRSAPGSGTAVEVVLPCPGA